MMAAAAMCTLLLRADSVSAIQARMDQSAPSFHGLTANIQVTEFNATLTDKTVEAGTFQMQKRKAGDVRAIITFSGSNDARTIAFFGKTVRVYYPNLSSYQDYDLGDKAQLTNQLLLLGFGTSGSDLAASYDISAEGEETIGGKSTTKLRLMPKDPAVKQRLAKVEIWIPGDASYPVQQKFYEGASGNWRQVTYSDIQLNPALPPTLELKLPKGVKRQSQ
jgi:outer membrane lipoprotein-sorting protein